MSLTRLIALTLLDVILAILLAFGVVVLQAALTSPNTTWGTLRALRAVGVPLRPLGLQDRLDRAMAWRFHVSAWCVTVPADDAALLGWLRQQPGLEGVAVDREQLREPGAQGEVQRVTVGHDGPADTRRLDVPWKDLGYGLGQPKPFTMWFLKSPDARYTPTDQQLVLIVLACLMAGLFTVGIVRMWQTRNQEPVEQIRDTAGLLTGLGLGVALAALYWLYHQAALHWGGAMVALSPSWQALPISGVDMVRSDLPVFWQGVEPHVFLLAVLGLATFLFPIAMMVFMSGVFRRWTQAGWVKTGCVLAAAVTATLLLSRTYFPVLFVSLLLLTWLGHRSRSLGPPLVSLIVVCAAVVGIVFGAIPSVAHPVNQLPGTWQAAAGPGNPLGPRLIPPSLVKLRFLHGGGADSNEVEVSQGDLRIVSTAWHYDWIANDTIILTWIRNNQDYPHTTWATEWTSETYRVEVNWEDLTLTRVGDGKVQKFHRVSGAR
jgi:hypothetical protein